MALVSSAKAEIERPAISMIPQTLEVTHENDHHRGIFSCWQLQRTPSVSWTFDIGPFPFGGFLNEFMHGTYTAKATSLVPSATLPLAQGIRFFISEPQGSLKPCFSPKATART